MNKYPKIGVAVICVNNCNEVLFGHRHTSAPDTGGIYQPGTYTLPGGKQEFGETITEAAIRELKEETGISVETTDLRLLGVNDEISEDRHFLTVTYVASVDGQKPQVTEPDKIDGWAFYQIQSIPEPLYAPSAKSMQLFADRSLIQELPEKKPLYDNDNRRLPGWDFNVGWNACLQHIKESRETGLNQK